MDEVLRRIFKFAGNILDVILKKSIRRKGQAFIVFDSEEAAKKAEIMDGFTMYGKQIRVARARTHSDVTVEKKVPNVFPDHKRKRLMIKGTVATSKYRQQLLT